jgi:hypothetical protein
MAQLFGLGLAVEVAGNLIALRRIIWTFGIAKEDRREERVLLLLNGAITRGQDWFTLSLDDIDRR